MAAVRYTSSFMFSAIKKGNWTASSGQSYDALSDVTGAPSPADSASNAVPTAINDSASVIKGSDADSLRGNEHIGFRVGRPTDLAKKNYALSRIVPQIEVTMPANASIQVATMQMREKGWKVISTTEFAGAKSRQWISATGAFAYPAKTWPRCTLNVDDSKENPPLIPVGFVLYDYVTKDGRRTTWHEAGMKWEYVSIPTMSGLAVEGHTTGTQPTFTWTFADSDNGFQTGSHLVIYPGDGTDIKSPGKTGGFAVNQIRYTSSANHTVGDYDESSDESDPNYPKGPENMLAFGQQYTAFVRAFKGNYITSGFVPTAWSSITFTITAPTPLAPTFNTPVFEQAENYAVLSVFDNNNRMSWANSNFEGGIGDWADDDDSASPAGLATNTSTLTYTSDGSPPMGYALKVTPTETSGNVAVISQQLISVTGFTQFYLMLDIKSATTVRNAQPFVRYFRANGEKIYDDIDTSTATSTSTWTTITHDHISPTTAAWAQVGVRINSVTATSEIQYIDKVSFGLSNTWSPGSDSTELQVERSSDGQINWVPVHTTPTLNPLTGRWRKDDFGTKPGSVNYYRSRILVDIGGAIGASAWTVSTSLTNTNTPSWWFCVSPTMDMSRMFSHSLTSNVATINTSEPHNFYVGQKIRIYTLTTPYSGVFTVRSVPNSTSFTFSLVNADVTFAYASGGFVSGLTAMGNVKVVAEQSSIVESAGVFKPLGSTESVVVSGDLYDEDGSMTVMTTTAAEWTALSRIIEAKDPIVVHDLYGRSRWVRFTERNWSINGTAPNQVRQLTLDYVSVEDH